MNPAVANKLIPVLLNEINDLKAGRDRYRSRIGKLTYFDLMAKGLCPALCCEFATAQGCTYDAETLSVADWRAGLKEKSPAPFGQLPLLECEGTVIAQATAVCAYVGHVSNTAGGNPKDFGLSQMLLAEGDEIFADMNKNVANIFHTPDTLNAETNETFWQERMVGHHVLRLEGILDGMETFTATGTSVGELYLWGMLYQACQVRPKLLESAACLKKWHVKLAKHEITQRVVSGKSKLGELKAYFVAFQ